MRIFLSFIMYLMLIPMSAFSQGDSRYGNSAGITHGASVSYMSLPLDFVRYKWYNTSRAITEELDAKGFGIKYELSVPLFRTRMQIMTGLGFSYFLCKEDYDKDLILAGTTDRFFPNEIFTVAEEENYDIATYRQHAIEYMYLSVPINIGYKILDKKGFIVVPYMGITMKYNLSYIEKIEYDTFSYNDLYMNVFDKGYVKNDAARFMFKYDFGLELGYRHLYATVDYAKDLSRLFDEVVFKPDSKRESNYTGPKTMHNWQVGVGYRF